MPVIGGWRKARDELSNVYVPKLASNLCHVALVIDFNGRGPARYEEVIEVVPEHLRSRVCVLGSAREPRDLRQHLAGSNEAVGWLADELYHQSSTNLIPLGRTSCQHNLQEIDRVGNVFRSLLFPS